MVYVGGGNTENMLAIWRVHGVDRALRRAWEAGVVMTGQSAGSLCWFETGTTDSFGKGLAALSGGLGFVPGSHAPHYDGEANRRPRYQRSWPRASCPPAMRPTTAPRSCSTARSSSRSSRRGPTARAYRVERGPDGTRRRDRRCRRATWADPPRPAPSRGRARPTSPTTRTASGPFERSRAGGGRSRRSSPQPGGTRPGARSASGASTNRRGGAAGVGHLEQPGGLGRIASRRRRDRASAGRSTAEPRPTEDEEVEVELARAPATALPATERALERLEPGQQRQRAGSPGPGPAGTSSATTALWNSGWSVTPTGAVDVQPRDAAEHAPRAGPATAHGLGQRRRGITDVRAETDVGADASGRHGPLVEGG